MVSNSDVRLEDWKVGRSRLGALSIRPKNSGLKFQNFMWRMEQYFQEISRLVAPAWLDRTVPFTLGRKFPEMQDRQVLETEICRMEQKFMIRPVQPKKRGPPQMVDLLFRTFFGWTEPNHSVSDRNFRKFWSNEKRSWSPYRIVLSRLRTKSATFPLNTVQHC